MRSQWDWLSKPTNQLEKPAPKRNNGVRQLGLSWWREVEWLCYLVSCAFYPASLQLRCFELLINDVDIFNLQKNNFFFFLHFLFFLDAGSWSRKSKRQFICCRRKQRRFRTSKSSRRSTLRKTRRFWSSRTIISRNWLLSKNGFKSSANKLIKFRVTRWDQVTLMPSTRNKEKSR